MDALHPFDHQIVGQRVSTVVSIILYPLYLTIHREQAILLIATSCNKGGNVLHNRPYRLTATVIALPRHRTQVLLRRPYGPVCLGRGL